MQRTRRKLDTRARYLYLYQVVNDSRRDSSVRTTSVRLIVDPRNRDVKMLPFGSRIPPRTLVLAWHRDRYRSQAAQAFVELAGELAEATG